MDARLTPSESKDPYSSGRRGRGGGSRSSKGRSNDRTDCEGRGNGAKGMSKRKAGDVLIHQKDGHQHSERDGTKARTTDDRCRAEIAGRMLPSHSTARGNNPPVRGKSEVGVHKIDKSQCQPFVRKKKQNKKKKEGSVCNGDWSLSIQFLKAPFAPNRRLATSRGQQTSATEDTSKTKGSHVRSPAIPPASRPTPPGQFVTVATASV